MLMNAPDDRSSAQSRSSAGFTLIEIMVVVVILGLLATMVATNVMQVGDDAKIKAARTSIKTIEQAVEMYVLEVGHFPQSLADLTIKGESGGPYLKTIEQAPWGEDFQLHGDNKDAVEVVSFGPDRNEGSEDDISSRKR